LRRLVAAHAEGTAGLVLGLVAAVAALGVYAHAAGPVGAGIDRVAGGIFGAARVLVPVGLAVGAVALISGRSHGEPARVVVGLALSILAAVGLLHIAHGTPSWSAPASTLRHAGGVLGALVAGPLHAAIGGLGATLALFVIGTVGLLVGLDIPARRAVLALFDGMRAGFQTLRNWLSARAAVAEPETATARSAPSAPPPTPPTVDVVEETDELDEFDDDPPDDDAAPVEDLAVVRDREFALDLAAARHTPVPPGEQLAIALGPAGEPGHWKLPAPTSLKHADAKPIDLRLVEEGGRQLEATLEQFGVEARLVGQTIGPTVTRYELELGPGVAVKKVLNLSHDIAYAMASAGDVRIALIPGRSAVGVEVPNQKRQLVALGDILTSEEAHSARHPLEVGLGRDIAGRSVMVNLATMPHLLIAGATGAGKSSCINSLVTSVLMRATPEQVRLLLVDPKRVELGVYNGLPHLLTEVVVNPKKAANALEWAVREMEMRYDLLAEVGVRDITGYNDAYDRGDLAPEPGSDKRYERLPFILIVVDELNDLMMVAARDVETSICRIAQMARAVGIHLVIATQRPSVDVITGVIKANIPSRLAFSVSSIADSRVILDAAGAEKLIGKGDMLLLTASSSRGQRIQGSWVDEDDVRKVVAHWRRQVTELRYVEGLGEDTRSGRTTDGDLDDDDDLLDEAMELVVRSGLGSTSMLQRKLRVGFARAGRLMDLLEQRGVVGPSEGSKARAVLMTADEFEARRPRV